MIFWPGVGRGGQFEESFAGPLYFEKLLVHYTVQKSPLCIYFEGIFQTMGWGWGGGGNTNINTSSDITQTAT